MYLSLLLLLPIREALNWLTDTTETATENFDTQSAYRRKVSGMVYHDAWLHAQTCKTRLCCDCVKENNNATEETADFVKLS